jgi:hypothetical protein
LSRDSTRIQRWLDKDSTRKRKGSMMKSEDPARRGSFHSGELPVPSLQSHAAAGSDIPQLLELKRENARLQQLVGELLVKNQQLRERYCGSGDEAEGAEPARMRSYPVGIWRIGAEPIE